MIRFTKRELDVLRSYLNTYKTWKEKYSNKVERLSMIVNRALSWTSYKGSAYWNRENLLYSIINKLISKYGEDKIWSEEELKKEVKRQTLILYYE